MTTPKGWRPVIDGDDWMRHMEKSVMHEERRPRIQQASDLLGPGMGPHAMALEDWNAPEAQFNGFWLADNARHGPNPNGLFLGVTIAGTTHITQLAFAHDDEGASQPVFSRQIHSHVARPVFQKWRQINPRMVGMMVMIPNGLTLPDGWLLCDGRSHLVADYPLLATHLPTSGSSFTVPDLSAPLGVRWIIQT